LRALTCDLPLARSAPHGTLYVPAFTARNIVDELRVKCRFGLRAAEGGDAADSVHTDGNGAWVHDADGCAAVLALCDVASHEAECPFELLTCAHGPLHELPLCGAQFRRADQPAHDRACALRPRPCAQGCAALLPPRALRDALERGGGDDAERAIAALVAHTHAHGVCSHSGVIICDTLLSVMAENVAHAGVQREACSLLKALTTDAVRPLIVIAAVVGAVRAAVGAHLQDESVHVQACLALRQCAGGATYNESEHKFALALAAAGGLRAVLDDMRAFPSSASVQEAACGALHRITRPDENTVAAGSSGGIEALVAAMSAHGAHAGVQERACGALANMAANADNKAKAGSTGAIEAVVAAMNAHGAHAHVQVYACWALRSMAVIADNQAKAGSTGAIEAIVAVMNAHGAHAGVQEHACWALANIAANAATHVKAGSSGAIEAVVAAMSAHGAHAGLQERACYALANWAVASRAAATAAAAAASAAAQRASAAAAQHGCQR
jgi:hypothetical protein